MTSNRLEYIDLARAIAIFSVLIYHFPLRNEIWGLTTFINTYFLSLFFFLSGLLTHPKANSEWMKSKIKRLMIPLFSFYILFIPFLAWYRNTPLTLTIHNVLWSEAKGGYWFIFTLFAALTTIWMIYVVYQKLSLPRWLYATLLVLPWIIACGVSILLPQEISYLLSIPSFRRYYIFMLLGMLCQRPNIQIIWRNKFAYIGISIAFFLMVFVSLLKYQSVDSNIGFIVWMITNISGCLFFVETCRRICMHTKLPKWVIWISMDSLGIYLGHYFFLYSTKNLFMQLPISPYISLIPYTIILMGISLFMTRLLRKNRITSKIFLGQ